MIESKMFIAVKTEKEKKKEVWHDHQKCPDCQKRMAKEGKFCKIWYYEGVGIPFEKSEEK